MEGSTARPDILGELRIGASEPLDRLVPIVYAELRAIAHRQLAMGGRGGTLATTALVHEAYIKLVDQSQAQWRDRTHFFAVAALAMRHVLVDRAKARRRFWLAASFYLVSPETPPQGLTTRVGSPKPTR